MYVLRAKCLHRDCGHERRVDATREANDYVGKSVFANVVARSKHQRAKHLLEVGFFFGDDSLQIARLVSWRTTDCNHTSSSPQLWRRDIYVHDQ